jgi:hypothetical protein
MAITIKSFDWNFGDNVLAGEGLIVTKPTGVAVGDLLVAYSFCTGDTTDLTVGGDFSNITSVVKGTGLSFKALYRIANAGDVSASSYTFSASEDQGKFFGFIYRISGFNASSPIDTSNSGIVTISATPSFNASITPTTAGNMLLMFGCSVYCDVNGSFDSQAIVTANPTWTEDIEYWGIEDEGRGFFASHATRTATSATGNVSFNNNSEANPSNGVIIVSITTDDPITTSTSTSTSTTSTSTSTSTTSSSSSSTSTTTTAQPPPIFFDDQAPPKLRITGFRFT